MWKCKILTKINQFKKFKLFSGKLFLAQFSLAKSFNSIFQKYKICSTKFIEISRVALYFHKFNFINCFSLKVVKTLITHMFHIPQCNDSALFFCYKYRNSKANNNLCWFCGLKTTKRVNKNNPLQTNIIKFYSNFTFASNFFIFPFSQTQ